MHIAFALLRRQWVYAGSALEKSIYTLYMADTSRFISFFGAEKNVLQEAEQRYDSGRFVQQLVTQYEYNASGTRIGAMEKDVQSGKTQYIKYTTEKL